MHSLRTALCAVGMLAGFLLGPAALVVAWQLLMVSGADPTPQPLSVAQLIDKGPGGNLHVELTDLAFGEPVVVEDGGDWKAAWFPVRPADTKVPAAKLVFFRTEHVESQAELDDLLRRPTLTALVTTPLADQSIWKVHADKELHKAYPKLDPAGVIFLAEPIADLGAAGIVTPAVLFNKAVAPVAGVLGLCLLVAGVVCVVLLGRGDGNSTAAAPQTAGQAAQAAPKRAHEHGRLAIEIPISEHRFAFWSVAPRAFAVGGVAAVLVLIGLGLLLGLEGALVEKNYAPVPGLALGAALTLAGGLAMAWAVYCMFTGQVTEMFVCPSGLRWRVQAQQRQVLWEEIAAVDVFQSVTVSRRGADWAGRTTLRLRSGETLLLRSYALSDYPRFVSNVRSRVDAVNQDIDSRGGGQGGLFGVGQGGSARR
jgi:hypothetical protein